MERDLLYINSIKSGLIEYMNNLLYLTEQFIAKHHKFDQNKVLRDMDIIHDLINIAKQTNNINDLYNIKANISIIESRINTNEYNFKIDNLTSREKDLVMRGYDIEDVIALSEYTDEEAKEAAKQIFERITRNCTSVENPICYYLGGQPGCGKTTISMMLKEQIENNNAIEIGIDNYRTYHPHYLEMERIIKKHWEGRSETPNDSPGNDIADFTHAFAGYVTDLLIELATSKELGNSYNILMEWGMRTPEGPLKCMKDLKQKGYKNIVNFIAVHEDISREACKIRADIMNKQEHIVRRVPDSFHSLSVSTLPDSADTIYQVGVLLDKSVDELFISTRDGKQVWSKENDSLPSKIYYNILHNKDLSKNMHNDPLFAETAYYNESHGFENKVSGNVKRTN